MPVTLPVRIRMDSFTLNLSLCTESIKRAAEELFSDLNRHGTQLDFRVHNPTVGQLVDHYIKSGGLQRCLSKQGTVSATLA